MNNKSVKPSRQQILNQVTRFLSLPIFLGLWEIVSRSGLTNIVLFPPPSLVAVSLYQWAKDGSLIIDVLMSISRVVIGFAAGAIAGIIAGILTGRYQCLSNLLTPIFQLLRPIPPIAFVPIVILWFGLSELGKWFLVFWGVFFTVWISAHLGVQRVDRTLTRAAQCLGTPEKRMLPEVLLPGALPYILVGLRTSVSISFYTLVAAELAGTFSGIAYRIEIAQQNLQVGQTIGGLIILGIISALADRLFGSLSKRVVWWT
ncbi:MAG: putative aliphatic sulfonates transport permease protein SsuC [Chroococcidiopsis cubana SAG 39.79]|uniref:ABC transporter permease n=1 Tax=Chroococcidiopsis cubana SAG 39.79 TaxID=388085 RepID=A0AB37UDV5_9CYAN|nr:ABC transporter permease [Chroococcidiopsis cubana]MDZ4872206.1 putative aliphatic sulfonates transport permease protein SsuC [Chroococcidiopsis cubana SAG 39.79]PSB63942.1 ABC transporter permease [Chroococcidiopsis cubana CCALA 043]RUT07976.1 ABC transporter permease [Chroococcidiopsis cubana SAG 39.79]